jgi:hypothetical protein
VTIERPAGILSWPWVFIGDYDLNGEVSISDLTPLAMRLGNTVDGVLGDAVEYEGDPDVVCDGDLNREVNIADLTQIGQHYGQRLAGFHVYKSDDWWRDYPRPEFSAPALTQYSQASLGQSVADTAVTRRKIVLGVTEDPRGDYWWVVPYGNGWEGKASSSALETGIRPARHDLDFGLQWDAETETLSWNWNLVGDSTRSTEVNLADLSPIALSLGTLPENLPGSSSYLADVCRNGIVDMVDMVPVYFYLYENVNGISVFTAATIGELPTDPYVVPTAQALVDVPMVYDPVPAAGTSTILGSLPSGTYAWIRPFTDVAASREYGAASEVIQIP